MFIGIISDTHGENDLTQKAIQFCKDWKVQRIIHCGDIGSPSTVDFFQDIPTDFVFGNCDGSMTRTLTKKIDEINGKLHNWFGEIEVEGKKIAFLHGHEELRLKQEIASQKWDLICFGHLHQHSLSEFGKTLVLNPGALQQRSERPGFCIIELPEMSISRISI